MRFDFDIIKLILLSCYNKLAILSLITTNIQKIVDDLMFILLTYLKKGVNISNKNGGSIQRTSVWNFRENNYLLSLRRFSLKPCSTFESTFQVSYYTIL